MFDIEQITHCGFYHTMLHVCVMHFKTAKGVSWMGQSVETCRFIAVWTVIILDFNSMDRAT